MLQVQEAVKHSLEAFGQVFPTNEMKGIRLEEVELTEDGKLWLVTVSFLNPDYESELKTSAAQVTEVERMLGRTPVISARRRLVKRIRLKSDDGAFVGITNGITD